MGRNKKIGLKNKELIVTSNLQLPTPQKIFYQHCKKLSEVILNAISYADRK